MIEIEFLNKAIKKVEDKLNSKSLNYVASVEIYAAPGYSGKSIEEIAKFVFGSTAKVGGSCQASAKEISDDLISGLSYGGDGGAYASREYVGTDEHLRDLENVKSKLKPLLAKCNLYINFWLKEGHPFYPVFWDFAFILEDGSDAYIAIGSSSD